MPRTGPNGEYTLPPNTNDQQPNTTIRSSMFNGFATDVQQALNTEWPAGLLPEIPEDKIPELTADKLPVVPVEKGGTGGETTAEAINNLGLDTTVERVGELSENAVQVDRAQTFSIAEKLQGQKNSGTGMALLASGSASSVSSIDVFFTDYPEYKSFQLEVIDIVPGTDNVFAGLRISEDGSTFISAAGSYKWAYGAVYSINTSFYGMASNSDSQINLAGGIGAGAAEGMSGTVKILDTANTNVRKKLYYDIVAHQYDDVSGRSFGSGLRVSAGAIKGVRLFFTTGNIASGSYRLYGLL